MVWLNELGSFFIAFLPRDDEILLRDNWRNDSFTERTCDPVQIQWNVVDLM